MISRANHPQKGIIDFEVENVPLDEELSQYDALELEELLSHSFSNIEVRQYSGKQIKNAGRNFRRWEGDLKKSTEIIFSYRQEHHRPLETITNLVEKHCSDINVKFSSYRRLKRIPSIINKLSRPTLDGKVYGGMCITRMQDIAGCRFVFEKLDDLNLARQGLESHLSFYSRIKYIKTFDYISHPKKDDCGYRSLHLLYEYKSKNRRSYQVEVQFRTELQNIWATTVEIIDIINGTKVKNTSFYRNNEKNVEQIKWEELLKLMSDYIAHRENTHLLSNSSLQAISSRLHELNRELNIIKVMSAFKMVGAEQNLQEPSLTRTDLYILFLVDTKNKKVEYAKKFDSEVYAIAYYNFLERTYAGNQNYNALLLSTRDIASLKTSYPNYVGSCDGFLRLLKLAML